MPHVNRIYNELAPTLAAAVWISGGHAPPPPEHREFLYNWLPFPTVSKSNPFWDHGKFQRNIRTTHDLPPSENIK